MPRRVKQKGKPANDTTLNPMSAKKKKELPKETEELDSNPISVDEFDDLPRRPTVVDELDDLPKKPATVDEAIDLFYPDIKKAPPLNVIPRDVHKGLMKGGAWAQPNRGGASFSKEGMGAVYGGDSDVVIRVNKDFAKKHIKWVKDPLARGLTPNFYPEGIAPDGTPIGARKSYIPRHQLEYLDLSDDGPARWQNYPERDTK